jgi:hypothetical protein
MTTTTNITGLDEAGAAASAVSNMNDYVPAAPVRALAQRTQDLAAGIATVLALVDRDDFAAELAAFEGADHQRALSPQDRCELLKLAIAVARDIADSSARHHLWVDRHAVVVSRDTMVLPVGEDLS